MQNISFYEQVGIIVPGTVFLLGVMFLLPDLQTVLKANDLSVGGFGVVVIISYAAGNLIATIGNLLERPFWWCFGGLPSCWVTHDQSHILNDAQVLQVQDRLVSRLELNVGAIKGMQHRAWRPYFDQLYQDVLTNNPGRIEAFNGTYGLNRGLGCAMIMLAFAVPFLRWDRWALSILCILLAAAFWYRAYRFGIHLAREVYLRFLLLPSTR
jgi:hypothetical protein